MQLPRFPPMATNDFGHIASNVVLAVHLLERTDIVTALHAFQVDDGRYRGEQKRNNCLVLAYLTRCNRPAVHIGRSGGEQFHIPFKTHLPAAVETDSSLHLIARPIQEIALQHFRHPSGQTPTTRLGKKRTTRGVVATLVARTAGDNTTLRMRCQIGLLPLL